MAGDPLSRPKAQLDKPARERLEATAVEMRERVEDNVAFQLAQRGLDADPAEVDSLGSDARRLGAAIELEAVDGDAEVVPESVDSKVL